MPTFPKRYADQVAKLRVPSGFLLVVAFAWLARPTWLSLALGIPISLIGLAVRGWAAGHLDKNQELATSGPYAYIRNPLYVGTLVVAAGLVVSAMRWELAILFGAVFILVYLPVIELEEQHLRKLFPPFAEYCRRVPMLIPRGRRTSGTKPFRFSLYKRNEEYNAAVGYALGLAWLLWRTVAA
jgi:protein-S-isoprenylcysteine O-methyltransferase Ste14